MGDAEADLRAVEGSGRFGISFGVCSALAQEMLTQQFENRGLGVEVGGEGDWRFFRLEGHGNNYLTDLFAYVSQGMGAVVMTNSSNGEAVKAHILRAIATEYDWPDLMPEEVDVVSLSDEVLGSLAGRYSFRGRDRVVRLDQGRLVQSSEGSPDQELLALSDMRIPTDHSYSSLASSSRCWSSFPVRSSTGPQPSWRGPAPWT